MCFYFKEYTKQKLPNTKISRNKRNHMEELLDSVHFNGHTLVTHALKS